MESTSMKETERNCVLCCQELDIFALGKCEHPVCYRCSTKMRVLCDQKYCAVCREELDKVIFVKDLQPFSTLPFQQLQCEKKHDIYFSDGKIYSQFRRLLLPECPHCPEPKVFSKFEELEQHMRKQHELFCCKLCTKHLKIFSHERKWYNRKDLARHRTQGDPDDTSHRGHPLCKFCDDRYLDNDELLKHLRRDHYFCHFCDADGAQEYYSDYQYLSEHFRESHYLCEEGRCSTEQFTHAFRTEIDYKAHKASAHSKNRAEARQNRHIDLQFTYAPRQQRRNEGMVSAEDYEEMRQARAGRGRTQGHQQNTRGSWRYNREEEDREVAAAMRASMAVRRQEERGAAQERSAPKHRKEERMERMERMETEETRHRAGPIKPPSEPPVRTMKSSSPLDGDDFPALGTMAPAPIPSLKQPAPAAAPPPAALKEDDFPSLSAAKVSSPMTPAYTAQPRKHSSFHDEDFPALVSKIRPPKQSGGANSAWAHGGSKPASQPSLPKAPPPADPPLPRPAGLQPLSRPAGPQSLPRPAGPQPLPRSAGPQPLTRPAGPQPLHSSSSSSSSRKKKKAGADGENARPEPPSEDDGTMTRQEFRAVPTMLDISSLLTVKGPAPSPSASNPSPPTPHPNPSPAPKAAKKKKQQQQATPAPPPPSSASPASADTVPRVAAVTQKENAPKTDGHAPKSPNAGKTNGLAKGCMEKPEKPLSAGATVFKPRTTATPQPSPAPTPEEEEVEKEEEEEFPALTSKKPPPGFKSSFPLKSSAPQTALPPPPPGLASVPSKPPPGFTGIPLNSNVAEPPAPARPPQLPGTYLVPENFQQRNMELIQSIKNFLHNDESQFNQFKNYSGQFRQGLMSAAQYHCSCKDLLGENFGRIFNELLVLLPDTGKQQELLVAHGDSKALEKQGGAGGGKARKNKKSAWQTPSNAANANAAELDCQICPTCRQVLAPKDFNSHKTLHMGENEEFPSLQAISRIIS